MLKLIKTQYYHVDSEGLNMCYCSYPIMPNTEDYLSHVAITWDIKTKKVIKYLEDWDVELEMKFGEGSRYKEVYCLVTPHEIGRTEYEDINLHIGDKFFEGTFTNGKCKITILRNITQNIMKFYVDVYSECNDEYYGVETEPYLTEEDRMVTALTCGEVPPLPYEYMSWGVYDLWDKKFPNIGLASIAKFLDICMTGIQEIILLPRELKQMKQKLNEETEELNN